MTGIGPDTKDALARETPAAEHCRAALLDALAFYGADARRERFVTYRNAVARLFWSLLDDRAAPGIVATPTKRLRARARFSIALPAPMREEPPRQTRRCDQLAEVRAAFLVCGTLAAGARGYHLEFAPPDARRADRLRSTLHALDVRARTSVRRRRTVYYMKDADAIVDLLARIGAHEAVLALEDVRALRETKNRIHRLVNTETANLERAARAAAAHRRTIEYVERAWGLRRLSPALREVATLRARYPGDSLAELGKRCTPPIGKQTVSSRLAALSRFAARLRAARQGRQPAGR